jgi:hypothetical protein
MFPSIGALLKNPTIKLTEKAILDNMAKSEPNRITEFKTMLQQIHQQQQKDQAAEAASSRPYIVPGTMDSHEVQKVQNINNPINKPKR